MPFRRLVLFSAAALLLALAGCENFDLFQSEKTLNEKIQGRWTQVRLPASNPQEYWTFNNGIVYREVGNPPRYDTGTYSISTTLDNALIDLQEFDTLDKITAEWDIVRLNDNVLSIATDKNGDPGVTQREFYR
jgi:hypothetical protein